MKKCVKTAINAVLSTALVMLIIGCWTLVGVKASDDTTYTFSDYREDGDKDAEGNWTDVPQQEGYVFSGWYDTDGNAAPKDAITDDYKAKFVKEDVLSLKLQLKSSKSTDPVTSKTSEADLRLITSVDTLDYSSVGFKVSGKVTKTYISNVVYQTIKGYTYTDENQVEQTYTPKVFCEDSNYFMSHIVQGADNTADSHDATDQFGTTLTVVPQWTTLDGTLVYGTERSFEINDGIEEYVAEIDELSEAGEKTDHVWYTTLADAVTDANASTKADAVTIGLLRDFSLGDGVSTTRDVNIQNITSEDITISRSNKITHYTMINHIPTEDATLTIGTNDVGAAKIIFDANDSSENVTNKSVALYNNSTTGTMYLNKNVTVKNVKTVVDGSHGAGGFNNKGTAYVSATFDGCEGGMGGAIYSTGATLEFAGTIQNCKAYQGAGIDVTGTLNMTGGSITNCEATMYGGAIYGSGDATAIINVSGGSITSCSATEEGGAIRAATVNFTGGTIESCEAAKGAGIRIYTGTIDGTIKNCISTGTDEKTSLGGAVYAMGGKVTVNTGNITGCKAYLGGGFYVADGTLEIKGGTIDNCDSLGNATGNSRGGGVYSLGTVNMTAGTVKNGNAYRGAGLYAGGTGTINVSGGEITSCASNEAGGGMYGEGGATINFNGGTISDCTAVNGGAIRLTKGSLKGTISGCTSTSIAGGVYVSGSASVTMAGATIQNCESKNGGAIYADNGTFTMTSGTITGCKATSNGGGVYVTTGTFAMKNGTITGCSANNGAGVYENSGSSTMSGGTISDCIATTNGGGVNVNAGTFGMTSGTITGCSATNGGGIFENAGTATLSGDGTIEKCEATTGGGVFTNGGTFNMSAGEINECTSASTGGGIHGVTGGTINFTGGTIYKCSAATNGGGIRIIRGEIGGGTIDSCTAAGYGGGVIFDGATVTGVSMTAGTIQNCSAKYGGGIGMSYNAVAKELIISGGLVQNCTATTAGGGVAFEEPSTLTMTGGTIKNCTSAKQGGGIFEGKATSVINLQGVVIDNCDSTATNETDGRGGGVYSLSPVNMTTGTVKDCNAQRGSGIYMGAETGTLTMTGGTITNCDSVGNGGGIYGEGSSTINFNGGTIEDCQALVGGGIRLALGAVKGTITNCHAVDNNTTDTTKAYYGGGVYAAGDITMTGTIEDCTAYRGGGIWTSSTLTMSSGNITNCDSEEHGGGIYGTGAATINFNGGTIASCSSSIGSGGGIRLTKGTLKGTITGCSAKNGGGVFMDGTPTVTMDGATIEQCTASSNGGGILVNEAGTLTLSSGTITGCTADNYGGGVHVAKNGVFKMSNGTITACEGNPGGGIELATGADFTMTGGKLTNNVSGALGGAIYAIGDNILTLTAGEISGNTSTHEDLNGDKNAIQATNCGTTSQLTLGSEFNMGANSIHFTGVTERTTPVMKITGSSLTNHSASKPLYIAMSDGQQGLVQIQCDSNAAASAINAVLNSADRKAMFTVNSSVIETTSMAINAMTFNVLGSGKEGDGAIGSGTYLSPSVRAPHVYNYLKSSGMDLIGVQEAQEGTYDWQAGFKNNLSSTYEMIRITDQNGSPSTIGIGNGLIILYKKDRFTLVDSGLAQYTSDTGRYYQWAKFTDKYTNKTVYMTNTHWSVLKNTDGTTNWTDDYDVRIEQANQLLTFWKNNVENNILIATGDYNSRQERGEFATLSGGIYKAADVAGGFTVNELHVDHILVNPNLTAVHSYTTGTLIFEHTDGQQYHMSDHAPRKATILIK